MTRTAGAMPTYRGTWTVAILEGGQLRAYERRDALASLLEEELEVVTVPAPLEDRDEVRQHVGPRVDSLRLEDTGGGRAEALTALDRGDHVVPGHPELSFQALARHLDRGPHLEHPRGSREGRHERLELLYDAELRPRRSLGGSGRASPVDVMDATVLAWTAWRVARDEAGSLETLQRQPLSA